MNNYTNQDLIELANMIYGEVGSTDYDTMVTVGSTALNRLNSGRVQEFGPSLYDVIHKENAYYAVQNENKPYKWAVAKDFPDKDEETRYKQSLAVASGLLKGSIQLKEGHFYFTDKEISQMKRKKNFDFSQVKELGKTGKYKVFGY